MSRRLAVALLFLGMTGETAAAAAAAAAGQAPVAVVTGANTGIGFHVAGQLAEKGYDVVLACRSEEKAQAAVERMRELYPAGRAPQVRALDLSSLASVCCFAAGLSAACKRLDLLVCNAGLNSKSVSKEPGEQLTADGVDVVYQTNFLSHLLLVLFLLPLLKAARGRVVSLTSVVHRGAPRDALPRTREVREPYVSMYGPSKLAQILGTAELHRRFGESSGVAFHCVNPGGVASDIWRNYPAWQKWLFSALLADSEVAARTVVQACLCEEGRHAAEPQYWNGYMGAARATAFEYWSPLPAGRAGKLVASSPSEDARDPELAAQVWDDAMESLEAAGLSVSASGEVKAC